MAINSSPKETHFEGASILELPVLTEPTRYRGLHSRTEPTGIPSREVMRIFKLERYLHSFRDMLDIVKDGRSDRSQGLPLCRHDRGPFNAEPRQVYKFWASAQGRSFAIHLGGAPPFQRLRVTCALD